MLSGDVLGLEDVEQYPSLLDARSNSPAQLWQSKMPPGFSDAIWGVKSHTTQLGTIIPSQNEGEESGGNSR